MNSTLSTARLADNASCPAPYGARPIRPLVALRSFRRVVANKDDTREVFEIIRALSGRSIPRGYFHLVSTVEGGRQAYDAPELATLFEDKAWLANFPIGSVGAAYRDFIARRGFSASGLADESKKIGDPRVDDRHPIAWYARRIRDIHDVWHVLTGYGTDAMGEACLLGFTHAQAGNGALLFLAIAASLELKRLNWRTPYIAAVSQAWRNGRRARSLDAIDYGELFAEPLTTARKRLHIRPPSIYQRVGLAARNGYRYPAEPNTFELWPAS